MRRRWQVEGHAKGRHCRVFRPGGVPRSLPRRGIGVGDEGLQFGDLGLKGCGQRTGLGAHAGREGDLEESGLERLKASEEGVGDRNQIGILRSRCDLL